MRKSQWNYNKWMRQPWGPNYNEKAEDRKKDQKQSKVSGGL